MLRNLLVDVPSVCSTSVRSLYKFSARSRKTGRGCGHYVKPSQEWRWAKATGRTFTRLNGRKFGFDMGLEDRLLLTSLGQKNRRLDAKKMKQLGEIYEDQLSQIIAFHPELAELQLKINRVKVNTSCTEIVVYWLRDGINDEKTSLLLDDHRHSVKTQLQAAVGGTCPEVKFVGDGTHLIVEEMDQLFRKADYGVDYRTLSKAARVLGNVEEAETERNEVKEKRIPEWRRRLLEKNRDRVKTETE